MNTPTTVADIELRHLRYFVAVAEELHFGRAAKRLNLAQPPLSQQIRKLEQILGVSLFDRTSRSVALTAAGVSFLERAQRTLRNVQRDMDEAHSIGQGRVGSLHVGFVGSAMLTSLPAIFRAYREAYPLVRLHLHESFTAKVIDGLQNGSLDAGLLRDGDPVVDLNAVTIYSEPFIAVLPASHPRGPPENHLPRRPAPRALRLLPTQRRQPRLRKTPGPLRSPRLPPPDRSGSIPLAQHPPPRWSRPGGLNRPAVRPPTRLPRRSLPPPANRQTRPQNPKPHRASHHPGRVSPHRPTLCPNSSGGFFNPGMIDPDTEGYAGTVAPKLICLSDCWLSPLIYRAFRSPKILQAP